MRLGLLGPSNGDMAALKRAAAFVAHEAQVERAVYLGADGAIDAAVSELAEEILGVDPRNQPLHARAFESCARGDAAAIDDFLQTERRWHQLRVIESLPSHRSRAVEMLEGRLCVMLYDKALLDEEDILPAALIAFGKGPRPVIKRVGLRTFVSPGAMGPGKSGVMVLEERHGGVEALHFDEAFRPLEYSHIPLPTSTKMRVSR